MLRRKVMNEIHCMIYYNFTRSPKKFSWSSTKKKRSNKKDKWQTIIGDAVYISFDASFVSFVHIQVIQDGFCSAQ